MAVAAPLPLQNQTPWEEPVLETTMLPLNILPAEFHPGPIKEDPVLLKMAGPLKMSAVPLPRYQTCAGIGKGSAGLESIGAGAVVIIGACLGGVYHTIESRAVESKYPGRLPSGCRRWPYYVQTRGKVLAPVKVKFIGVFPDCVKALRNKNPALKPAEPTGIACGQGRCSRAAIRAQVDTTRTRRGNDDIAVEQVI